MFEVVGADRYWVGVLLLMELGIAGREAIRGI